MWRRPKLPLKIRHVSAQAFRNLGNRRHPDTSPQSHWGRGSACGGWGASELNPHAAPQLRTSLKRQAGRLRRGGCVVLGGLGGGRTHLSWGPEASGWEFAHTTGRKALEMSIRPTYSTIGRKAH